MFLCHRGENAINWHIARALYNLTAIGVHNDYLLIRYYSSYPANSTIAYSGVDEMHTTVVKW